MASRFYEPVVLEAGVRRCLICERERELDKLDTCVSPLSKHRVWFCKDTAECLAQVAPQPATTKKAK